MGSWPGYNFLCVNLLSSKVSWQQAKFELEIYDGQISLGGNWKFEPIYLFFFNYFWLQLNQFEMSIDVLLPDTELLCIRHVEGDEG